MSTSHTRLDQDLKVLQAMAEQMEAYLLSKTLFQQMEPNLPKLTLGGYLLRQHRLTALNALLEASAQTALEQASTHAEAIIKQQTRHFIAKANQELAARLRQWDAYLQDIAEAEGPPSLTNYAVSVETRVMITALIGRLEASAAPVTSDVAQKCATLDQRLQARWQAGAFLWPEDWQVAYPEADYWWLYGQLRP